MSVGMWRMAEAVLMEWGWSSMMEGAWRAAAAPIFELRLIVTHRWLRAAWPMGGPVRLGRRS